MRLNHPTITRWRNRVIFGPWSVVRPLVRLKTHRQLTQIAGIFDPAFYLDQIVHVRQRRMASRDPALHYLLHGANLGYLPSPLFDLPRAREVHPGVRARRLFTTTLATGEPPLLKPAPLPGHDPRPGVLLLDHARGGGSSQFLDLLAERLDAEGERVIRTLRLDGPEPRFSVHTDNGPELVTLGPDIAPLLARLGVARLIVNHVIDLPLATVAGLPALTKQLGIPYDVFLHDYLAVCPRVNLITTDGRYCGLPALATCQACVMPLGIAMQEWRAASAALLHGARRVTVPSRDLAVRMAQVFGDIALDIWSPEPEIPLPSTAVQPPREGPLSVVVIGALNQAKGFDILLALARQARDTEAPISFTLLGFSSDDEAIRQAGVSITGRYRNAEARARLVAMNPDLVLFPAIWPETWSFTLTHALATGMDIAAFDLGAISDRLNSNSQAHRLPLSLADDPATLLDRLIGFAHARRARILRQAAATQPRLATRVPDWFDPASPDGCAAPRVLPAAPDAPMGH